MSNGFGGLGPISEWRDALAAILLDAETAVTNNDSAARLAAQKAFRAFIKASPAKCNFLDDIAARAATDVFISQVDASLAALSARNDELRALTEAMSGVAAEANKDARSIMFEDTLEALNKTKTLLGTFKSIEESLDSPDQNVLGKIAAVADAINSLATELGDDNE